MAPFLSAEWVAALSAAAAGAVIDPDVALRLQQVVGDVRYGVVVGDGRIEVVPGPLDGAEVTITTDPAEAAAIARGERSAQDAFGAGALRLGGDVGALLRAAPALAALDDLFADVRAATSF